MHLLAVVMGKLQVSSKVDLMSMCVDDNPDEMSCNGTLAYMHVDEM